MPLLFASRMQFECCGVNSADDFDQKSLFRHLNPGRAVPEVCCLRNEQLMNVDECLGGNMPFRIKVSILPRAQTLALSMRNNVYIMCLISKLVSSIKNICEYA